MIEHRLRWIEILERTPDRFASAFRQLGSAAGRRPASDEWSVAEQWEHVRASDAIIRPRIMHVLVRPGAPLTAFDERAWAQLAARARTPVDEQLTAFAAVRAETVALLRALSDEEWDAFGVHEERGEMTVAMVAEHLSDHEEGHQRQLSEALALLSG